MNFYFWISILSFILILYLIYDIYFKNFIYTSFNKSNLKSIIVYKTLLPKIRLGKDYDGGYIICDIPNINYDCFLAGGIETDLSFEEVRKQAWENTVLTKANGLVNGEQ